MPLRLIQVLALVAACASWSSLMACTCGGTNLEGYFGSRPYVFTAIVTSARIDPDGSIVADFAVIENFKGDIPFKQLTSSQDGCSIPTWVGAEYLFFLRNDGDFGSCTGSMILEPGVGHPWVGILEAYKAGNTPDLSSPWSMYEGDGSCILDTNFLITDLHRVSSLVIRYRYARAETPYPDAPELNRPGYALVILQLPARDETPGASIVMKTASQKFQALWRKGRGRPLHGGAFILENNDAIAFAAALPGTSAVTLQGATGEHAAINGTAIRTTHAGTAITDFNACVERTM